MGAGGAVGLCWLPTGAGGATLGLVALVLGLLVLLLGRAAARATAARATAQKWQAVAARRGTLRDDQARDALREIAIQPPLTAAEEAAIINLTAGEIAEGVASGQLSAARVLAVFARRSHVHGFADGLNAVTELLYAPAMARAREIDDAVAAGGGVSGGGGGRRRLRRGSNPSSAALSPPPPRRRILEGVPVSIKEIIDVTGTDSTCGLAARCFKPAAEDALVVRLLMEAGAVPFVKTNVPQSLISYETINNIYGRTLNPWDKARTSGGSSGGESALLASRCTPLSVGTDIGGSIRIPSAFSGLYGIKPTPDRVSKKGLGVPRKNNRNGQNVVRVSCGPMATCVHDLSLVCKAWWGNGRMWGEDPYVYPKLFDRQTYETGKGRPLRVGLVTSDRYYEPCAAVQRALQEAADALRKSGHEVVPMELPCSGWEIIQTCYRLMGADGELHFMCEGLEGEELMYMYKDLKKYASIPNWLRAIFCKILSAFGEHRLVNTMRTVRTGGANTREFWEICILLERMQQAFVEHLRAHELDALLTPISPLPAFLHDHSPRLMIASSLSFLPNLLRWPSGVVPVTRVRPDEQTYDLESLPPNQRDSLSRLGQQQVQGSAGLPVGVQVMACHAQDELCLHVMREIERQVQFREVPPGYEAPVVGGDGVGDGGRARGGRRLRRKSGGP